MERCVKFHSRSYNPFLKKKNLSLKWRQHTIFTFRALGSVFEEKESLFQMMAEHQLDSRALGSLLRKKIIAQNDRRIVSGLVFEWKETLAEHYFDSQDLIGPVFEEKYSISQTNFLWLRINNWMMKILPLIHELGKILPRNCYSDTLHSSSLLLLLLLLLLMLSLPAPPSVKEKFKIYLSINPGVRLYVPCCPSLQYIIH